MIILKSKKEIEKMREAGKMAAHVHRLLREQVAPGITTYDLDKLAEETIKKQGAIASFKGYHGFPGSICASKNEVVIHGIPSKDVRLEEGDIISIDIGVLWKGYHGDCARTHPVGSISKVHQDLIDVTKQSFFEGFNRAYVGNRLSDISHAVQTYVEANHFSVVRDFVGHGVGRDLHEEPEVRNFGPPNHGPRLQEGMVIAVEPMVNQGVYGVTVLEDGWTTVTNDGLYAAHYEHTFAITNEGPILLTDGDEE